jgi:hypothetical protein
MVPWEYYTVILPILSHQCGAIVPVPYRILGYRIHGYGRIRYGYTTVGAVTVRLQEKNRNNNCNCNIYIQGTSLILFERLEMFFSFEIRIVGINKIIRKRHVFLFYSF